MGIGGLVGIAAGAAGLVVVIVIVVINIVVCYLRKQRARPELPAGAVELSSTVDAPISLHSVSAIPMDMRPNDAALAAAATESQTNLSHEGVRPQMKGRFDIHTGKENPKFDPETGVQNW